jgi:hypothetical protein
MSVPRGSGANRIDEQQCRSRRFAPPTPPRRRLVSNVGFRKRDITVSRGTAGPTKQVAVTRLPSYRANCDPANSPASCTISVRSGFHLETSISVCNVSCDSRARLIKAKCAVERGAGTCSRGVDVCLVIDVAADVVIAHLWRCEVTPFVDHRFESAQEPLKLPPPQATALVMATRRGVLPPPCLDRSSGLAAVPRQFLRMYV